jgi:hypothetical protein
MPKPTSKSRQELRSRFVRNAIPTEADFADLIAASLNQADDGVLKLPDQPLGLVRQKPDQPVLRFFADPAAEGSVWQVQLGAGDKPGFGLAAADGKLALFVDGKTGNVGIGTTTPGAKLTVSGANNASKDHESGMNAGGQLAIKGNAPQIDFIDTDHNDWSIHVNSNKMYFIRQPWEHTDLVLDGGGKIGIGTAEPRAKLQIVHTNQDPNGGALMLGPTGQSNLRLGYNEGYSWIQSHDNKPLSINGIGNSVGIGTTNPEFKLDVNGTVRLGGFTTEEKDEWPNIVWCRDLAKGWDEGLYKHGKHYGFFGRAGFGVHIHESRSFELFSTMARPLLGVEGGSGNTSIRGQTNILTGANPIRFSSVWTAFPDDKTNGAEICNDTSGHKTLMIVGNKSNGGARRVSIWDILEVNGTCMANGSFQVNNNGNTFKIETLADRAIFTLAKAFHGPGRQISWDGDNNWDQYSDETLKTNINIETGILPRLLQIDVKSFQWKDDLESKKRQLGFIAQDVRSAFPDLVKEKPFGDQSLMSLNYTNFGILAVGAIKELNAIMTTKIQELRIEIEDLKRQIGA